MQLPKILLHCDILHLVLPSTGSVCTVDDFCSVSEVNTSQTEAELCRQSRGAGGGGGGGSTNLAERELANNNGIS
jgi:hypothetical protein